MATQQFKIWECLVCGWIYNEAEGCPDEGIAPGTRWEDIPDDWMCPECGVGKEDFEMVEVITKEVAETPTATAIASDAVSPSANDEDPIVIIGTGLAGYNLAKELRKLGNNTGLVLITADDGHFYSKPLLSTGFHRGKTADDLSQATATAMAEQIKADVRAFTKVTAIDSAARTLQLSSQQSGSETLRYSKLILAVGANCITAPLSGNAADQVYQINDLMDYRRFRTAVAGKKRVLVIGAGLIGSEYANDMVQSGFEVTAVDPLATPLATLLPPVAAESVQRALTNAGVTFHFGTVVDAINTAPDGNGVIATLKNGTQVAADIVLSAIGVRPNLALANAAGLTCDRGIVVDRTLQSSDPNIYALGDCAQVDGHVLYYVAPLMHCCRALAQTLSGKPTAVHYGVMPVTVKTTLFPVVTNPPPRDVDGQWEFTGDVENGIKAVFRDASGQIYGFALTGKCIADKVELESKTRPIM